MLMAPIRQGEGAIEQESPTGPIRFHQRLHPVRLPENSRGKAHASWQSKYKLDLVVQQ